MSPISMTSSSAALFSPVYPAQHSCATGGPPLRARAVRKGFTIVVVGADLQAQQTLPPSSPRAGEHYDYDILRLFVRARHLACISHSRLVPGSMMSSSSTSGTSSKSGLDAALPVEIRRHYQSPRFEAYTP